jgi:serine/threonine-protein phosphatase 2A activator
MSGSVSPLPQLRRITLSEVTECKDLPRPRIKTDYDLESWKKTRSYRDFAIFLRRLNEAVVGHYLPSNTEPSSEVIRPYVSVLCSVNLVSGHRETCGTFGYARWVDS